VQRKKNTTSSFSEEGDLRGRSCWKRKKVPSSRRAIGLLRGVAQSGEMKEGKKKKKWGWKSRPNAGGGGEGKSNGH